MLMHFHVHIYGTIRMPQPSEFFYGISLTSIVVSKKEKGQRNGKSKGSGT